MIGSGQLLLRPSRQFDKADKFNNVSRYLGYANIFKIKKKKWVKDPEMGRRQILIEANGRLRTAAEGLG